MRLRVFEGVVYLLGMEEVLGFVGKCRWCYFLNFKKGGGKWEVGNLKFFIFVYYLLLYFCVCIVVIYLFLFFNWGYI